MGKSACGISTESSNPTSTLQVAETDHYDLEQSMEIEVMLRKAAVEMLDCGAFSWVCHQKTKLTTARGLPTSQLIVNPIPVENFHI